MYVTQILKNGIGTIKEIINTAGTYNTDIMSL